MSVLIKALTRQFDTRLPFSRTTFIIVAVWACTFTAFITLGLSR